MFTGRSLGTILGVLLAAASSHAMSIAATGEPVRVSGAERRTLAPEIAIGPRDEIHVIWLDREVQDAKPPDPDLEKYGHSHLSSMDLYHAISRDGGRTFSAAVRVNRQSGLVWGFAVSKPRIAVARSGVIHVFYPANELSPVNGKPVLTAHYVRSSDGGRSFSAPQRLNSLPDTDMSEVIHGGFASAHAFGTMGLAPDGTVHVVWIDTRDMTPADADDAVAYGAVSRDEGKSFLTEHLALEDEVCPCCQLTLAFDARSNPYLGSRRVLPSGERPSTVARGNGAAQRPFGPRVSLGGAPWRIDGCPLKPTVVSIDGKHVYAAAFNGAEDPAGVYVAVSEDGGASFARPQAAHPDALVSDAPSMVIAGGGAVLAWHAKVGDTRRVFLRTVGPRGEMGPVAELAAAPGTAQTPALARRADGRVQAVWQQGDAIHTVALELRPDTGAAAPAGASGAPAARIAQLTAQQLGPLLARERGQIVILNLWATWCSPCLKEIPDLLRLERDLAPRGVRLIGVAMDEPADLATRVEPFRSKHFPQFRTYARAEPDMDALVSTIDPAWNEILPTTYLIGRDGKIVRRIQGKMSYEELRAAVEKIE